MPRNAITGADTDQASAAALTRASRPRQTKGYSSLNDGASLNECWEVDILLPATILPHPI
jgi:hypothetical protein